MTIVTGFLGAGKTTLVRRFLETPEGRGTALVVNEFGSVGIDDALLRESTDEVTLLGNGCLCCNTRSDLQVALRKLVADRDRGKIPHFGRVLIETSGLADISPILQTFSTDRALGSRVRHRGGARRGRRGDGLQNLDKAPEARKQAILADRLVISKSDLADTSGSKKLAAKLKELNPRAVIDMAVNGDIDPKAPDRLRPGPTPSSGIPASSPRPPTATASSASSCARRRRWNGRCFSARWRR